MPTMPRPKQGSIARMERLKPLTDWLNRNNGRLLSSMENRDSARAVEFWQVNGKLLLVVLMGRNYSGYGVDGWDIFRPASDENSVALTLGEAALYCGCQGCAGLGPASK